MEGNDDDEEEQEGMLPALKVNEKLTNNYITATNVFSVHQVVIQTSLVKKLEELELVVHQRMRQLFLLLSQEIM